MAKGSYNVHKEESSRLDNSKLPRGVKRLSEVDYGDYFEETGDEGDEDSTSCASSSRSRSPGLPQDPPMGQGNQREIDGEKEKIAPRSGLQFKVGPPFMETKIDTELFNSTGVSILPVIDSRIDRGFELNPQGEWIGYKRNYFTLVTSFGFSNLTRKQTMQEKFYVLDVAGNPVDIKFFALRIISNCCEDGATVTLVQHTAKRDKGPQILPPIYPALPGPLPSHSIIKKTANIRNNEKIENLNKLFYLNVTKRELPGSILDEYPSGPISIAARYERIQFSTAINCRKYSTVNRHFILSAQLLGFIKEDQSVVLAHSSTPPLIVRGRSPSNYQMDFKRKAKSGKKVDDHYLANVRSREVDYINDYDIRVASSLSNSQNYENGEDEPSYKHYLYNSDDENTNNTNFPNFSSMLPPIEDYLSHLKESYAYHAQAHALRPDVQSSPFNEREDRDSLLVNQIPRGLNYFESDEIFKEYIDEQKLAPLDLNHKRPKRSEKMASSKSKSKRRKPFNDYYIEDSFKSDYFIKDINEVKEQEEDDEEEEYLRFQEDLEECKYKYIK